MSLIDISYPHNANMAIYPGNPGYEFEMVKDINKGDSCNIARITMGTHTGTHIDAPAHFICNGDTIDQIRLDKINGIAHVFDFSGRAEIRVSELSDRGIDLGDIVLFKTDNSTRFNGVKLLHEYTTLTYDAAKYLAEKRVNLVGIDYMTIERPRDLREENKSIHLTLLSSGIVILESIWLSEVEQGRYRLHCFPLNITGADGSPVRAVLEA